MIPRLAFSACGVGLSTMDRGVLGFLDDMILNSVLFTCIRPFVSARNRRREIYILLYTKLSPATPFFNYLRKVLFTNYD
jgi:hypothetical protein